MVTKLILLTAGLAAATVASHCSSCNMTIKSDLRNDDVLFRLRSSFGFDPTAPRTIPEDVLAKAQAIAQHVGIQYDQEDKAVTEAIHIFAVEDENDDENAARFHFHNDTQSRRVERADLSLFIEKPDSESDSTDRKEVTINVFENAGNGAKGELLASHRALTPAHGAAQHRVRLNSQAVERLAQKDAASLIVEAMLDGENLVVLPGDDGSTSHPLSLSVVISESKRAKRFVPNFCKKGEKDQKCCLFSSIIDFEQIGWHFVVAPRKWDAFACAGHCKERSGHMLPHISRDTALDSAGIGATCCHPDAYDSMQMIYINPSNNVVVVEIQGMVAVRCACA